MSQKRRLADEDAASGVERELLRFAAQVHRQVQSIAETENGARRAMSLSKGASALVAESTLSIIGTICRRLFVAVRHKREK